MRNLFFYLLVIFGFSYQSVKAQCNGVISNYLSHTRSACVGGLYTYSYTYQVRKSMGNPSFYFERSCDNQVSFQQVGNCIAGLTNTFTNYTFSFTCSCSDFAWVRVHPFSSQNCNGNDCLGVSTLLDLKLLSFNVKKVVDGSVCPSWEVTNEKNMIKYDVEYSKNGLDFQLFGSLISNNSDKKQLYKICSVTNINNGYFRLVMIGTEQKKNYSKIIFLKSEDERSILVSNLVKDVLRLDPKSIDEYQINKYLITDINGRVVKSGVLNQAEISTFELSNGIYWLSLLDRLQINNNKAKFIKF